MSFIRTKTVRGREYKYLVRNQREGDRVCQRVVKYLGPVEPVYKIQVTRNSNAWLFVKDLTNEETKHLNSMLDSDSRFTRDRAKIVLLSSEGVQCKKIAEKLDCDERKVRYAIKDFNEKRLASICRKKRKYEKKILAWQRLKIVEAASKHPVTLGLPFTTWSLKKLRAYAVKKSIVEKICVETIRKIIRENGIKPKKSKRFQYSNDPDFFKKKQAIDDLKQNPPKNGVVLSFDEKGKTPVKQYGGTRWQYENKYHVPYRQKVKGLFDIFAAKNIHSKERHCRFYVWKNSFIVIDFLEWLSNEVYPGKDLYIILDNWRAHKSEAIKAYSDLHPRIHLAYLPTTSSWMNDIERDFSRVQNEVLNNSNFNSTSDAVKTISSFFENVLNHT